MGEASSHYAFAFPGPSQPGKPCGHLGGIAPSSSSPNSRCASASSVFARWMYIPSQHGEHQQRQNGRPLKQEAEHDRDEGQILRMPDVRVGAYGRQPVLFLRLVEHVPSGRQQHETAPDEHAAEDMQHAEVRVALQPENGRPEVPGVCDIRSIPG